MRRKSWGTFTFILVLTLRLGGVARAQEPVPVGPNAPVGSSFTYQGQVKDTNVPVTGNCDFQFSMWNALSGGTQIGSMLTQTGVTVSEGLFTVALDFGAAAFDGSARWQAGSGTTDQPFCQK
jgi:hypothetical protein